MRVPDVSGSCQLRVWPGASAQSARAAHAADPSPSAESYFCGQFRA